VDHLALVDARIYDARLTQKVLIEDFQVLRFVVSHHVSENGEKFVRERIRFPGMMGGGSHNAPLAGFQFSRSTQTSSCLVAPAMSSRFPVSAATRIISAARSQTGRACWNGSRSRIRIAPSIRVTRCEPGPPMSVIGWASGSVRSGAAGIGRERNLGEIAVGLA